jgi:hypothetical protein
MSDKLEIHGMDVATMTEVVRTLENKGGPKIGGKYLPTKVSPTEEITWDIVKAVSPIASFKAVDGETELAGKNAYDRGYADVVNMGRKHRYNASDLRKIKEAGMLPVVDGAVSSIALIGAQAKAKVRAGLEEDKLAIDNRLEWMQVNALLGKISYTGKIKFSVDFGIKDGQSGVVPSILWSTIATAKPLADLQGWQQTVLDNTGILLDTVIMSRKALNYIKDSTLLATTMQYTNPLQSVEQARRIIEDNTGLTIEIYDTTYTSDNGGTTTRFLAANTIIMLPSASVLPEGVGKTMMVGHPLANYTPGMYVWEETKKDPYGLEVGVGLDAFPVITHPEALFNAVVF